MVLANELIMENFHHEIKNNELQVDQYLDGHFMHLRGHKSKMATWILRNSELSKYSDSCGQEF